MKKLDEVNNMPEIGEVARIIYFLREYVVGKRIKQIWTQNDSIVYGKGGTNCETFGAALQGKEVVNVGRQGKYFWLVMSEPPHAVLHFGMTGWIHLSNVNTMFHRRSVNDETWPPKYWKFHVELDDTPTTRFAFIDARRLARIGLLDVEASKVRMCSPLIENGPDPVVDSELVTIEWLTEQLKKRRLKIKVFLLDQGTISGIGNWVGDEILFQARIHPEQYTHTLSEAQINALFNSIHYVCRTAVANLSDPDKVDLDYFSAFPKNWLTNYRWVKGKRNIQAKLPTGESIIFLNVGGRTSAVVPHFQVVPTATLNIAPSETLDEKTGHVKSCYFNSTDTTEESLSQTQPQSTESKFKPDFTKKPKKRKRENSKNSSPKDK